MAESAIDARLLYGHDRISMPDRSQQGHWDAPEFLVRACNLYNLHCDMVTLLERSRFWVLHGCTEHGSPDARELIDLMDTLVYQAKKG